MSGVKNVKVVTEPLNDDTNVPQTLRKKKKCGGFHSFNLSPSIMKGVQKQGYKIPTPIQRKVVPILMNGRDCVAMARTGSGKTAAFLLPLLEKLLSTKTEMRGIKSLILSPTRELALQTSKFAKQLSRYTDLNVTCILGGDSMERQFASMHSQPDIVVATPGRFTHLCVEMSLTLDHIQYLVLDEVDRLFEMGGAAEQLNEIVARLPKTCARQTVLVSATLPKSLVDYLKQNKNGESRQLLTDPTLIRLDLEDKIPSTLRMVNLHLNSGDEKLSTLLYLLSEGLSSEVSNDENKKGWSVVVFCATRHHVDYLHLILNAASISNTYIYSKLDSTARKINIDKFKSGTVHVLLVTDLAARGLDMPLLDNVINFNFPSRPKLFIHRVGRVARAGRHGTAYSLIAGDELAYFCELQQFLQANSSSNGSSSASSVSSFVLSKCDLKYSKEHSSPYSLNNKIGKVAQHVFDNYTDQLDAYHSRSIDIESMKKVSENGFKQYLKSRPPASRNSIKCGKMLAKEIKCDEDACEHFIFATTASHSDGDHEGEDVTWKNAKGECKQDILAAIKNFRPSITILERNVSSSSNVSKSLDKTKIHSKYANNNATSNATSRSVMMAKRKLHDSTIDKTRASEFKQNEDRKRQKLSSINDSNRGGEVNLPISVDDAEIDLVFNEKMIIKGNKLRSRVKKTDKKKQKKEKVEIKDEENFIQYMPKDCHVENGLSVNSNVFDSAVLDLNDDESGKKKVSKSSTTVWDKNKKRYICKNDGAGKKVKTESGVWISASYKSDRYEKWRKGSKDDSFSSSNIPTPTTDTSYNNNKKQHSLNKMRTNMNGGGEKKNNHRVVRSELKRPEQILKERKLEAKKRRANDPKRKGKGRGGRK